MLIEYQVAWGVHASPYKQHIVGQRIKSSIRNDAPEPGIGDRYRLAVCSKEVKGFHVLAPLGPCAWLVLQLNDSNDFS